ncbi:hypothetical protein D5086_020771 [Populus alba]|uniref:Uncharacterized protein n=1 Tax=Populus alba TaxID=43335 RepID=A0ACC4BL15_POPAL
MDSKNGTPEEKGNASLPLGRGQIKAKIGEELRIFVTRGVGRKSEKDGGKSQQVTPAPSRQGNVIPSLVFQERRKKGEGVRFLAVYAVVKTCLASSPVPSSVLVFSVLTNIMSMRS